MRTKPITALTISLCLVLLLSAVALALDGEVIVSGKCTACHSTDRIKNAKKSTGEWAVTVDQEINRGAQLNSNERSAVIKYLASNYSASAQSAQAQQTAATSSSTSTSQVTPQQQAYTGIEMWQLILVGSSFIGSGLFLRRRK